MTTIDIKAQLKEALDKKNQKINSEGELNVDKRKGNKGVKGKAGRKPKLSTLITRGIKDYVDHHINEMVKIQIVDPKTGKTTIIDKPRVVRVLEKLYEIGINNESPDALKAWLDRALGKPIQQFAGVENKPILLKLDM